MNFIIKKKYLLKNGGYLLKIKKNDMMNLMRSKNAHVYC
jgi:hypothetical protein